MEALRLSTYVKRLFSILIVASAFSLSYGQMSDEKIAEAYSNSYNLEYQQRYLDAIRALDELYKNYESTYTVNLRIGWLYYLNGNFSNSQRHYLKALAIYPASVEAMLGLCNMFAAKQSWRELESQAIRILKVDYYNFDANLWIAYALRMQGKHAKAETYSRKMLLLYPSSVKLLNELGISLYNQKKFKGAQEIFASVLILDPLNIDASFFIKKLADNHNLK